MLMEKLLIKGRGSSMSTQAMVEGLKMVAHGITNRSRAM